VCCVCCDVSCVVGNNFCNGRLKIAKGGAQKMMKSGRGGVPICSHSA
jgi:hypothetical protein